MMSLITVEHGESWVQDEFWGGFFGCGSSPDPRHQSLGSVLGKSFSGCTNWDLSCRPVSLFVN